MPDDDSPLPSTADGRPADAPPPADPPSFPAADPRLDGAAPADDAATAPADPGPMTAQPLHHIELWTNDLAEAEPSFDWLMPELGFVPRPEDDWPGARMWHHPSGVYLVLEQPSDIKNRKHDRMRPGLNHLAFTVPDRATLDRLREESAPHGWEELFAEAYPHAGGEKHVALYLENTQGFEIEIVAAGP
ncbi:MAG: VOC family protein [Brachybacterium sp.]|nr:VOC family protein [Brachybacterium sp.]